MRIVKLVGALLVVLPLAAPQATRAQHVHPPVSPQNPPAENPAPKTDEPKEPIPPITDADRKAAFPDVTGGHEAHGDDWHYRVLFDQVEWQSGGSGSARIRNRTWVGGDVDRLWLRTEAESDGSDVERASIDALWGHSFSRWWDVVAGARQDFRPGGPQTWAAIGVQGLAPYWFEIEATGFLGADGRTRARLEVEYEMLLTNRLVLQPLAELEMYGKSDPERGVGAGLSSIETGLRLRYEIRRELAPYVGISWDRKLFGTADLARARGDEAGKARLVVGLRTWF